MIKNRMYLILVPALTLALTAAATFLSTQTDVRPDIGSVSFGFPLSWLSISHGFINAAPLWTVDWVGLTADLATWLVVSLAAAYVWVRLGSGNRSARLNLAANELTTQLTKVVHVEEAGERESPSRHREHQPVRDYGRTRVYAFLFLVAVPTFAYVSYFVEGEELITSFDDLAVLGVGAVALLLIAISWRKPTIMRLPRLNNTLFILGLWMVVFTIFALEVEAGFPEELVDEVPKLIISLLLVVNRFV